jgi:signal transduction histidine kinase
LASKLISSQEDERKRIARELHDDTVQQLALLSVEIHQMKQALPVSAEALRSRMNGLEKRASEIADGVQSLSHELHSSKLEYLGLASAMKGFCKEFGDKYEAEVDFDCEGMAPTVPQEISACLFRVLQEGLHNALKHSGVRFFEVKLHGSPSEIQLTVRDAGVGFDPQSARETQGLGLISMRERVRLVNGTISVTSRPQSGTEVSVRIHLPAAAPMEQTKLAGA